MLQYLGPGRRMRAKTKPNTKFPVWTPAVGTFFWISEDRRKGDEKGFIYIFILHLQMDVINKYKTEKKINIENTISGRILTSK